MDSFNNIITFFVTFSDGELQTFDVKSYKDGQPKLHDTVEMTDYIEECAGCNVFPIRITDSNGQDYYCDWKVNIIPAPMVRPYTSP